MIPAKMLTVDERESDEVGDHLTPALHREVGIQFHAVTLSREDRRRGERRTDAVNPAEHTGRCQLEGPTRRNRGPEYPSRSTCSEHRDRAHHKEWSP